MVRFQHEVPKIPHTSVAIPLLLQEPAGTIIAGPNKAVVALREGHRLSSGCRWVRVPSAAPNLMIGVGCQGSIPWSDCMIVAGAPPSVVVPMGSIPMSSNSYWGKVEVVETPGFEPGH